jgi:hypothetical protein
MHFWHRVIPKRRGITVKLASFKLKEAVYDFIRLRRAICESTSAVVMVDW